MEMTDEIPLEDHRYFRARMSHLETRHPAALLNHLEMGTLGEHLRDVTQRAIGALGHLVMNKNMPQDQANELVMNQIVADPQETSRLRDPQSKAKLRKLLNQYLQELPSNPRTYLSEDEITE